MITVASSTVITSNPVSNSVIESVSSSVSEFIFVHFAVDDQVLSGFEFYALIVAQIEI